MSLPPPLKPTHVEVVGIHPRYARLLVIEVTLDDLPTPEWIGFFEQSGKELPWIEMHPPQVVGQKIVLNPTDEDIEQEVAHIEERVLMANQRWLAMLAAAQKPTSTLDSDSDLFSADVRARIDAARKRTRSMSEAFSVQGFWRSDAWVTEDLMSLEGLPRD